jgi:hypothetical protein
LILCETTSTAVAKYALEGLTNKVLAAQYRTTLPDVDRIVAEMETVRRRLLAGSPKKKPTDSNQ